MSMPLSHFVEDTGRGKGKGKLRLRLMHISIRPGTCRAGNTYCVVFSLIYLLPENILNQKAKEE